MARSSRRGGRGAATARSCRAARRAARRRRSRRGCARARRAPTPAARSASRRRSPALSGIKPTYGRCSRWGVVAFASSLDQAGPMARDVRDCAILLAAMAGFDPKDATSLDAAVPDWEAALTGDLRGVRVGVPKEYRLDGIDPEIAAMWDAGLAWLKRRRRERRRRVAAAHEIRAARLLHRRAGRGVVQPRPLRRRPLRPAGGAAAAVSTRCTRRRARPASGPRSSAAS